MPWKEAKLVIALEPEAASVWCKKLPAEGFIAQKRGGDKLDQSPGTQYIVVDCGGGTIDITVHEVLDGGALKELHKASGNDLGAQTVDKKFKEFLREIFCHGVWDEYERKYPSEVQKMMYDFTVLKQVNEDAQITCPFNLGSLAQRKQKIEKFFETVRGASWNDGSIKISKEKMKSFFIESLNGITESLREILKKDFRIEFILLVGGYAESKILHQHIISQFGRQCKVLCPFRAQEAVVKGAVMFGRNPAVVASRKSAYTYGIEISPRFDESKHKAGKKYKSTTGERCKDVFMKLVEIDEDVGWDKPREYMLWPTEVDQESMSFRFFRTKRKDPLYVYEWGMEEFGSFVVNMPDIKRGMDRQVKLEIRFGFTEMTATATDMDSKSTKSVDLDFMTQW
ncbi:heat shock 70 kDa protein 12A-like protein [Lates japonicus]|uniref:Heat shock 70 kDa protein 12A-like protein n=1 Tax=Lates japonicus TaxID=270547 RepID=A0AAD3NBV9_LATJO|nr:heat shock 70 kDa protein 12A-like protein [Lates japonicus]